MITVICYAKQKLLKINMGWVKRGFFPRKSNDFSGFGRKISHVGWVKRGFSPREPNNFLRFGFRLRYGFSLLELLIALAIIAILICIAYPNYSEHLIAIRRTNVEAVLLDVAGRMEQFYAKGNTYDGATLAELGIDDSSYKKYYNIDIKATNNAYTLSAIPFGAQAKDDALCGTLSLDASGNKSISGSGTLDECWR